jgi:hypothetical protein
MADEIPDDKFKSDVMRFIEVAAQKFDGLIADVRTNSFKLDRLETKIDSVEGRLETKIDSVEGRLETKLDSVEKGVAVLTSEVRLLGGQFRDVAVMAIKDTKRIDDLEERVDDLESGVH